MAGLVERALTHQESVTLERLFKKEDHALHFPLKDAYFCPDCESVINSSIACPSCTNESGLMPLAKARW
jgi:hypothetical protein